MQYYRVFGHKQLIGDDQPVFDMGLVEDKRKFSYKRKGNGIFFCTLEHVHKWMEYGDRIAYITIPEDALVKHFDNFTKANKVVVTKIVNLVDFYMFYNMDFCILTVTYCRNALKYIPECNRSNVVCQIAIKNYPRDIQHLTNPPEYLRYTAMKLDVVVLSMIEQTDAICMSAVQIHHDALKYITNQTEAICLEAVLHNYKSAAYIKDQSDELWIKITSIDARAVIYSLTQTEPICLNAVRNKVSLEFIKNQTEAICMEAVKIKGSELRHVNKQTDDICVSAIKQNPYAYNYADKKTYKLALLAVSLEGKLIELFEPLTTPNYKQLCLAAITNCAFALRLIRIRPTYLMCLKAVTQNIEIVNYVCRDVHDLCMEVIKQEGITTESATKSTKPLTVAEQTTPESFTSESSSSELE